MAANVRLSETNNLIEKALSGLASRQRVISNNLANIETPGFKASRVDFEQQLQDELRRASGSPSVRLASFNPGHLAASAAGVDDPLSTVTLAPSTSTRADGNNVDVESEMIQLAETTLSYDALIQIIVSRMAMTRYVVNEGRR